MNSHSADTHLTQLTPRRSIMRSFTYLLWLFCETASWIVHPKSCLPRKIPGDAMSRRLIKWACSCSFGGTQPTTIFLPRWKGLTGSKRLRRKIKRLCSNFCGPFFSRIPAIFSSRPYTLLMGFGRGNFAVATKAP